jgi:hypothetical protein
MAVPDAFENRALDKLLEAVATIGANSNWLTVPEVIEGSPADAVEVAEGTVKLFVAFTGSTSEQDRYGASGRHYWRASYSAWCYATNDRDMTKLKSDVLRALYQYENSFSSTLNTMMEAESFSVRTDLQDAGLHVGVLSLGISFNTAHSDP